MSEKETVLMSYKQIQLAQATTKFINYEIYNRLKVGMNNKQARELAIQVFKENNVSRWHDIIIHFGKNTNCGYWTRQNIDPNIEFKLDDTVFIDIGIVVNKNLEGDYGETYYGGNDMRVKNMIHTSRYLWHYGYKLWRNNLETMTGVELYKLVSEECERCGYILKPEIGASGHHVGIFLSANSKLITHNDIIKPNLWIFEIFVYDKEIDRGAFYENALMLEQNDPKL